jgi:probable HAF family extracellular repeat protein
MGFNSSGIAVGGDSYSEAGTPPPIPTSHAFYSTYNITGGVLTCTNVNIDPLLGSPGNSVANAVNNNNQIVGQRGGASGRAFLYTIGDGYSLLPLLGTGTANSAQSIRDDGTVVGYSYTDAGNTVMRACIWQGGVATDLNTLINPASGWVLLRADGISGNYITGKGTIGGATHGFVLQLVPEPSSLLLAAGSLIGLLAYAWRKRK